jgi:hypothetical protein
MDDRFSEAARRAFSGSYGEARSRFLEAAPGARRYPSPVDGPAGETLSTDAAWIGPPDARIVLVTISATHGVEGYCGSACQLDFLLTGGPLPPDVAVLAVHALNCYGYAWDRRVTEEGCDLNRNFVDFDAPLPENPGHDELAAHLVPPALEGAAFEHAEAAIAAYRQKHSELAFQTARKSGQYRHPGGMFFGGLGPTAAGGRLRGLAAE